MAKLITKFKYLPPTKSGRGGYARYIATREGVDKIDESKRFAPATKKQKKLVQNILRDFPDAKEMLEYEDYQKNSTIGNASEFISRALEDNAGEALERDGYARYIATRPRAERYGSHGLFGDDNVEIQLAKVSEEINAHEGNIWTVILSLRREDAARLGYESGERWRDLLRSQTMTMAEHFKIPMEHLRWYAAFHNESHHPHVHLIVYSSDPSEGYLSKQGVSRIRSEIAGEIFAQDLHSAYEKQTACRNQLRGGNRELVAGIIARIHTGGYDNPEMEGLLTEIADRLHHTSGKLVYGYLPKGTKDLIDKAMDLLAADERIAKLYDRWYEQKEEILRTYNKKLPERLPLSQNQEFKSIRNAVVQEALHLTADRRLSLADEPELEISGDAVEPAAEPDLPDEAAELPSDLPDSEPVQPDNSDSKKWWSKEYKQARRALYGTKEKPPDLEQAYTLMLQEAETGNGYAMHDMGKILFQGMGRDKDETAAQEWFRKAHAAFLSAEQTADKKDYLQYRIGKLFSFGYGVEQDYAQAAEWYSKAVAERNPFAAYSLGGLCKRGQGVEQDDKRAFHLFCLAAEHERKPNAYAMYELGRMYKQGIGTEPDEGLSEKWYAAAYQGFVEMEKTMNDDKLQYRLGQMTMNGVGTEEDLPAAFLYFQKSAALGNSDAEYGLGRLYLNEDFEQHDVQKAVEHLTKAAEAGHDTAQYTLGKLYLEGKAVEKDIPRGFQYLEQALEKENQFAQYLLGKTLLKGEDVEADPLRGEQLLRASIAQGNTQAMYALGKAYLEGETLAKDIPQALELLIKAAEAGNEFAAYTLGKLYLEGKAVEKDAPRAIAYLEQAVKEENPFAQYLLGKTLLQGKETEPDPERGEQLLRASIAQGNPHAMYALGKAYLEGKTRTKNISEALTLLAEAAEEGNPFAAYTLGKTFLEGKEVGKDVPRAIAYLEQAVKEGNPFAQYLLGKTLLKGEDVEADPLRGEQLLAASAAQGNLYAAYTLGKVYLEGKGLPQNIPRSLELLGFAAGQNLAAAQYTLGKLYAEGTVVPKNIPAALDLLTKAAMQGNPYAGYRLGKLYLTGEDIPKDVPAALYWLTKSAEQGNPYAGYQLGRLYLYGKEVDRDIKKAIVLLTASAAQGNPYAAQLLKHYRQSKNWAAAMGAFRLLQHMAGAISGRLHSDEDGGRARTDRKLRRQIDEKKMLHGIRG